MDFLICIRNQKRIPINTAEGAPILQCKNKLNLTQILPHSFLQFSQENMEKAAFLVMFLVATASCECLIKFLMMHP